MVIGHGSGSFGHTPARKYGTRQGVSTPQQWNGFAEVWAEARALNDLVVAALIQAGLPAIAFPPSACIQASDGKIEGWNLLPFQRAIEKGLLPVVNGDTVFDEVRGGTILSTEDVFFYLARKFPVRRILLAGCEEGVWGKFPERENLIAEITPDTFAGLADSIQESAAVDVTGGMIAKVESMLGLIRENPQLEVVIFSGRQPNRVREALLGASPGTRIASGIVRIREENQ